MDLAAVVVIVQRRRPDAGLYAKLGAEKARLSGPEHSLVGERSSCEPSRHTVPVGARSIMIVNPTAPCRRAVRAVTGAV